jgi:hypothetical protein
VSRQRGKADAITGGDAVARGWGETHRRVGGGSARGRWIGPLNLRLLLRTRRIGPLRLRLLLRARGIGPLRLRLLTRRRCVRPLRLLLLARRLLGLLLRLRLWLAGRLGLLLLAGLRLLRLLLLARRLLRLLLLAGLLLLSRRLRPHPILLPPLHRRARRGLRLGFRLGLGLGSLLRLLYHSCRRGRADRLRLGSHLLVALHEFGRQSPGDAGHALGEHRLTFALQRFLGVEKFEGKQFPGVEIDAGAAAERQCDC